MIPTSHLEFSSKTVVFDFHVTGLVVNHRLDEGLDPKLEVAGGKQNVLPDVLMNAGVLLKKILNGFSIYPALLMASIVDVGDIMISQECRKVLRVPDVFTLLQNIADVYIFILFYLLSPHDRVKKI